MSTETKDPIFVIYVDGVATPVSRQEWEGNWLKWWKRINKGTQN